MANHDTNEALPEITEAMIASGESVIYSKLGSGLPAFLSGADLAVMVYQAMRIALAAASEEHPSTFVRNQREV